MSKAKKTGVAVGMAALALLGLTTGCRGGASLFSNDAFRGNWSCSGLTAAESSGTPAYAELGTVPTGQIVRVWDERSRDAVALEVLGGDFTDVAPGVYVARADGTIVAEDLVVDVLRCEGEPMEEARCTAIDAATLDVEVLEDGARRIAYRATSIEDHGPVAIDGSFVVGR